MSIAIIIESGTTRVFASATDWPGWSRSGVTEEDAIENLLAYRARYAKVLGSSKVAFRVSGKPDVIDRVAGDATTDFGAPSGIVLADQQAVSAAQLNRMIAIVSACWSAFDIAATDAAGVDLRTGPRGGGRQADAMQEHVLESEASYLRRIDAKAPKPVDDITESVAQERAALLEGVRRAVRDGLPESTPRGGAIWPVRYFFRRVAWHVLDHTWEIQDRAEG